MVKPKVPKLAGGKAAATAAATRSDAELEAASITSSPESSVHPECQTCRNAITQGRQRFNCDICGGAYHHTCLGLPEETLTKLNSIIEHTGWVCATCREDKKGEIHALRAGQSRLAEEVAKLHVIIEQLTARLSDVLTSATSRQTRADRTISDSMDPRDQPGSLSSALVAPSNWSDAVARVIRDSDRRKKNIIVSGLPEKDIDEDIQTFVNLCEDNLATKPHVNRAKCRRLGKVDKARPTPRKLLIQLDTDHAAQEVLRQARQLRSAEDAFTASSVYFNADLAPEQAKYAFEQRKKRRQVHRSQAATTLSPPASSFRA